MTTNENNLTIGKEFILPAMMTNNGFSAEDIGDDFEGLRISFPRIKIPSGGSLQFEVPGDNPEEPEYQKNITGIIVYTHAANAYWPVGAEYDENIPPFCASYDGKKGQGIPGGICLTCEEKLARICVPCIFCEAEKRFLSSFLCHLPVLLLFQILST